MKQTRTDLLQGTLDLLLQTDRSRAEAVRG
jgi:hypothetical protein